MPPIGFWFSGAAFAAFLAFAGAVVGTLGFMGYNWYRAAVGEQEKVADKAAAQTKEKSDQEAKAKRDSIKTALSDFLGRGERLTGRTLDAADATVENDANAWMNEASLYVRDNLGADHLARMNTGAGVTGFMHHAPTPARQSL